MKTNSLRIILLSAAISAVSFAGLARAADDSTTPAKPAAPATQPANGRRGNFNPTEQLATYRDRFEGITLTDDQMKKIDGFIDTATAAVKSAGEDRRAGFTAMRKLDEDVQSVLTDAQKTALRVKMSGMMLDRVKAMYTSPTLKLTDDQTAKINAIFEEAKKEAATAAASAPSPDQRGGGFQAIRGIREKVNAVLTPEQQKLLPQRGGQRGQRGTTPPATPQT